MDSDIDDNMSDDVNYNYDIINLKEESSPFHQTVKDVLSIYYKRIKEENEPENDPVKILQSRTLLAVEV